MTTMTTTMVKDFSVVVATKEMGAMLPDKTGTYRPFRMSWSQRTDYGYNRTEVTDPDGNKHDSWSEEHQEYKGWVTVSKDGMRYDFEVTPFWDDPEEQGCAEEYEVRIRVYADAPESDPEADAKSDSNPEADAKSDSNTEAPCFTKGRCALTDDPEVSWTNCRWWKNPTGPVTDPVYTGSCSGWHSAVHYEVDMIRLDEFLEDPLNSPELKMEVEDQKPDELVYVFSYPNPEGSPVFLFWNGYILTHEESNRSIVKDGPSVAAYLEAAMRIKRLRGENVAGSYEEARQVYAESIRRYDANN